MGDQRLIEAITSFDVALPGGGSFGVAAGDLFDASDPIVKGREALFGPVRVRSSRPAPASTSTSAAAETATAAPSERRTLTGRRAKDNAAKDAAAEPAEAPAIVKEKPDA